MRIVQQIIKNYTVGEGKERSSYWLTALPFTHHNFRGAKLLTSRSFDIMEVTLG